MEMDLNRYMVLKHNMLCCVVVALLCLLPISVLGQTGVYVPGAKQPRNMQKALHNPEVFQLLLQFTPSASSYGDAELDMLDSAYRIAFNQNNPMLYTMTIESYGTADEQQARQRADAVYRYFAMRSHAKVPIRLARNPIHCSCMGDTAEVLRFEVPTATATYNCATLPSERLLLRAGVPLENTVLVTFRNNPDECVGAARGCYLPSSDCAIHGYYSQLLLKKGSIRSIDGTKDTCQSDMEIVVEDHLDYRQLLVDYHLIPHRKQILVMAGYVVLKPSLPIDVGSCTEPQGDSITLRIPATQEQVDSKLRFFAKVRTARGVEYRAIPTRKAPGKQLLALQAPLNVTQLDTIYLGKKIDEKELSKYFFQVDTPTEAASFKVGKKFYVASRPDKHGEAEMKKPLRQLFRPIVEQEDDLPGHQSATPKGEEIED